MNVENNYIENGGGGGSVAAAAPFYPGGGKTQVFPGLSCGNGGGGGGHHTSPSPADSGVMSPMTPIEGAAVGTMTHLQQQQQQLQQQHYSPDHGSGTSGYSPFNHPSPADSGCFNASPYPMTSPSQNQVSEGLMAQNDQTAVNNVMQQQQQQNYNPASVDSGCSYNSGSPYPLTSPNSNVNNMGQSLAEEFDAIQQQQPQPSQQQQMQAHERQRLICDTKWLPDAVLWTVYEPAAELRRTAAAAAIRRLLLQHARAQPSNVHVRPI